MSQAISTGTFGVAKWVVSPNITQGTHTTITAAMASASSGDTIFVRDGTYTETLTLKAGVNISALVGEEKSANVTINLIATMTAAGTSVISGCRLTTNSAAIITVSGSANSIVNLDDCYLNCTNNTGLVLSSSGVSSSINLYNCSGDLGTTGISVHSVTGAGSITYQHCNFSNSGSSTSANTISSGTLQCYYTQFFNPITSSSTAAVTLQFCQINCTAINTTALTIGGSGSNNESNSLFSSGTASCVSISSTLNCNGSNISSSNTNAITGSGTINYSDLKFSSTSFLINSTLTQLGGTLKGSQIQSPSAGFIGEYITSTGTLALFNPGVTTNVTSISLTPGVWNVSGIGALTANNANFMQQIFVAISTTNSGLGTVGDTAFISTFQAAAATNGSSCGSIPDIRVVITSTTTYYINVAYNSSGNPGQCTARARISATRVG